MASRDFTSLESAVEHALESGKEREALQLLVDERERAQETGDHIRLAAVRYLALRLYERTEWTIAAEAARLMAATSRPNGLPSRAR
jgi:hypothetical protein